MINKREPMNAPRTRSTATMIQVGLKELLLRLATHLPIAAFWEYQRQTR